MPPVAVKSPTEEVAAPAKGVAEGEALGAALVFNPKSMPGCVAIADSSGDALGVVEAVGAREGNVLGSCAVVVSLVPLNMDENTSTRRIRHHAADRPVSA